MSQRFFIFALLCLVFSNTLAESATSLEEELRWLGAEGTVEVVSKQKEAINSAAGIVSVMSSDEIERYNAKNLSELLNRVTSVYTLGSGLFLDNTVSMRGDLFTHHSNHILLLINGRPCRDSYTGGLASAIYRDFPIHAIEKLEVIRGPGSVLYGTNAYSGVINIVTQKDKENALTVRGGHGSFNSGRAEMETAWKNDEVAMTAAMRYNTSDGWLYSATGEKEGQDKDYKQYSFRANDNAISGTFWGKYKEITLNGFVASSEHNHWGPLMIGNGQVIKGDKIFLDIGYKHEFNSHWSSQWNLTYNHVFDTFTVNIPQQNFPIRLNADDVLFEQTHFFNFFDNKLNFLLGGLLEWQNESLAPIYNHLKSSLYGEINYHLLPNLKLNAGGQWNRIERSLTRNVTINPVIEGLVGRLGLVYELSSHIGFKLLYSQAFRDPTTVELTDDDPIIFSGNALLQPEKVTTIDAQIFYQTPNYQVSLTAFRSKQSSLIERVTELGQTSIVKYENGGNAIFKGLEFESKIKPMTGLQLTGSYTFQTNKDLTHNYNNETPVPNHIAKMGVSYDITPQWQLSMFDTFFSAAKGVPGTAIVNPSAGNYHNLTANTRYRLNDLFGLNHNKAITFSLYATNLLNEKIYYPEVANRKINTVPGMPGRALFGELEIQF